MSAPPAPSPALPSPLRATSGILGALAVAAGAFGAHGLKAHVTPERLLAWETAARYHLIHVAVIFALSLMLEPAHADPPPAESPQARYARLASRLFLAGIALFSGSLYALVLLDAPRLGMITPLGGVSLILGWLCLSRIPSAAPSASPRSTP